MRGDNRANKGWDPKYIRKLINDAPRTAINAEYWNALWNLVITQGDHNAEAIEDLINGEIVISHYVHNQTVASDVWNIKHGLNKNPSVTVVDSGGTEVIGDVLHLDENTVRISFNAAFSGKAYFN